MRNEKINNEFGNKIGGSKRDLWRARGLMVEDILEMNEAEKDKYIKKNNVWPKPDYKELKNKLPLTVIYFRKKVRDAAASNPSSVANRDLYINSIRVIKELTENIKNEEDIKNMFTLLMEKGYFSTTNGRTYSISEEIREAGGSKLFNVIANVNITRLKREIDKKQFLYTDEEKFLSSFIFLEKNDLMEVDNQSVKEPEKEFGLKMPGCWMLVKGCTKEEFESIPNGYCIVLIKHEYISCFENIEIAKKELLKTAEKNEKTSNKKTQRKKKFIPTQLEHIKREGDKYINRHVTAEDYLDTFGFYGGEFGNWMTELDRQASLDMGYDAFMDLSKALEIEPIGISINKNLSIAFGARGSGAAMAHYEPLRRVINLTKTKGAGSLAHEYGHAIDYIMSDVINSDLKPLSSTYLNKEINIAFKEVKKAITYQNGKYTKYYENSVLFDKFHSKDSQGYWSSDIELFARAFACYVKDVLKQKGIRNDYLCGHADSAVDIIDGVTIKAFPENEERKVINKAISNFIKELNKLNAFYGCKEPVKTTKKENKVRELSAEEIAEYENLTTACYQMSIFDY